MKTQIQFTKIDGDNGVALIHGAVTSLGQAQQDLANKLNLPDIDASGEQALNTTLRNGGIDPTSITVDQLSE